MSDAAAREALAAYAHEAWAGWMEYLFRHGTQNEDGTFTINAPQVERWRRQMRTLYAELTEGEKDSDRQEADKMIGLVSLRIVALEAQLLAAQKTNTALIVRIVELEHEVVATRRTIEKARRHLYNPDGSEFETVRQAIVAFYALEAILRDEAPAEDLSPPMPIGDALSSVASQLAVMIIQERLAAGHPITFAGDVAAPREPVLTAAPGRCDHCGLPLVSAHVADEVIVANGERRAHVHRVCADYLRGQGWQVAARVRGM